MKILVTGGTGLIGGHLVPRLQELGHQVTVLTRRPDDARKKLNDRVTLWSTLEDKHNLDDIDAVINLAHSRQTLDDSAKRSPVPEPLAHHPETGGPH